MRRVKGAGCRESIRQFLTAEDELSVDPLVRRQTSKMDIIDSLLHYDRSINRRQVVQTDFDFQPQSKSKSLAVSDNRPFSPLKALQAVISFISIFFNCTFFEKSGLES